MDATATLGISDPTSGSIARAFNRSVGMRLADLEVDDLTASDLVLLCSTQHHLVHEDEVSASQAP